MINHEGETMKRTSVLLVLLLSIFNLNAFANTPTETYVHVENAYAPNGFDSNDNTEIIIEGYLPNACHKHPKATSKVVGNEIEITVTAYKYDVTNPFCPPMIVPFLHSSMVGVLKPGQYKIFVNRGTQYEKYSEIEIYKASSETVDDFLYANIEFIQTIPGTQKVALHGYQPSDCLEFDEVIYTHNSRDTYAILPKMKQISQFCPFKRTPFYAEWDIPNDIQREKVLLHARKMSGQSFNMIYHLQN